MKWEFSSGYIQNREILVHNFEKIQNVIKNILKTHKREEEFKYAKRNYSLKFEEIF